MSAVVQEKHIETIFDHKVTESELIDLVGEAEQESDYLYALNQTDAYVDLYFLYQLRRNHQKAETFLNKLDEKTRNRISMRCCVGQ